MRFLPDAGKIEGKWRRDETVGRPRRLDGHESEQTPGDGEGQGSLVCCNPRGRKESGMTKQLNNCKVTAVCFMIYLIQKDAKNKVALALIVPLLPIEDICF